MKKIFLLIILISIKSWGAGIEDFSFLGDDLNLSKVNQESLADHLRSLGDVDQLLYVRSLQDKDEKAFGCMVLALGTTLGDEQSKSIQYHGALELLCEMPEKSKNFFLYLSKNKIFFMDRFTPLDILFFYPDRHERLIQDLIKEGATRSPRQKSSYLLSCITDSQMIFQRYLTLRLR